MVASENSTEVRQTDAYLGSCRTYMMEVLIVNGFQPNQIKIKSFIKQK